MITKESIENLKSNLDVVDIISQFIELKKSGANFKACCPFHGEDTPSFVVSPIKQIYHCFGCGVGGDSIKFLMEYEKLSYPEALEKLSSMVNISLEYDKNFKKIDSSIIEKVNQYYQKLLTHNKIASQYLISRGISNFSIEKFEIGYADSSHNTINYLKSSFLNLSDAKEFGIIDNGQNGLYSRFIERITFPIYTISGNIVGFGGRTITGHNAKYINSPQTKVFNKSRLLYGYHLAKEMIYKQKSIIVTEGYLDVIMLHQAGFRNSVATLGTALTTEHLPLLRRGEPKVILAYDGDKAGLNAGYKASLILSNSDFMGGVVIFQDGLDPADMVVNNRIDELNKMFSNPIPFIAYVIDFIIKQYNLQNPQEKQKALKDTNNYLQTLNPLLQEEYQNYIARKLNINTQLVYVKHQNKQISNNLNVTRIDIAELSIIKTVLEDNRYLEILRLKITNDMFKTHRKELNLLFNDINNPSLLSILLQEELIVYNQEEFEKQLILLSLPYYKKQLQDLVYNDNLDFRTKSRTIRELQKKILHFKKSKLV